MSVMSKTFGYLELCGKSHEYLRRGCSFTPLCVKWAGDLVITEETILKQSEVNDIRGEEDEVQTTYTAPTEECSDIRAGIPTQYKVEETDIRTGAAKTFEYTIPKNPNEEDEKNWDLDIYQSNDDCAVLMDGGDALQTPGLERRVTSLCGTIDRSSGAFGPKAFYLDNRGSYAEDPDNGLLVAIGTGAVYSWEIRYSPVERNLTGGLIMSDDVTEAFVAALALEGMDETDILEFGMI